MKDFAPTVEYTQNEYWDLVLKGFEKAYENYQKNGLPDRMLYERYMQKFNYNISIRFEDEDAEFDGIELYYYNGENNLNNTGEHTLNIMRAKPNKIVLKWKVGLTEYGAYFWTDENKIIETFTNFYGNDTQKEGNLLIEVGKSNENFTFFLQNDFLRIEIPFEEIEAIIFKDKYESYRSPNYIRPQGGWRY